MSDVLIISENELREFVSLNGCAMDAVSAGLASLSAGKVLQPPVLSQSIAAANGEVDVKMAYIADLPMFALKISTGFFDNPKIGLPSLGGMVTLMCSRTGRVRAVLIDNGYLTDTRTALAGAIAIKHLSRPDSKTALIVGSGVQARLQAKALLLVRSVSSILVWGRDPAKAAACANEISRTVGVPTSPVDEIWRGMSDADIVVTTTSARAPVVNASWLRPGQTIVAVGADAEYKNEIEPAAFLIADRIVADCITQCERMGEIHHAVTSGAISNKSCIVELGDIVRGQAVGRSAPQEIIICDLTGTGVQDTAIANLAVQRVTEQQSATQEGKDVRA